MRDDRKLLREVENLPQEARAALEKARIAKAVRDLGYEPFEGNSLLAYEASKARFQMIQELREKYWNRYRRSASDLKRKGQWFWLAHRKFSPLELLVSIELQLEPFEEESTETQIAANSRIRILTELHEMDPPPTVRGKRLSSWRRYAIIFKLAKQGADFWLNVQDFTPARLYETQALKWKAADLAPFHVDSAIEQEATEAYARLMDELYAIYDQYEQRELRILATRQLPDLKRKGAEFWYVRRDFTAIELLVSQKHQLEPFAGDSAEICAASKARARILHELRDFWNEPPFYDLVDKHQQYGLIFSNLTKKDASFWHPYRNFTGKELLISQDLEIEPFLSESPLTRTAEKARARILTELYELRWVQHQYQREYETIVSDLRNQKADFWYAHQEFTALELLEVWHPDARPNSAPRRIDRLQRMLPTLADIIKVIAASALFTFFIGLFILCLLNFFASLI